MTARQLAEIIDIIGTEVHAEVKERAIAGITRRIIDPFSKRHGKILVGQGL